MVRPRTVTGADVPDIPCGGALAGTVIARLTVAHAPGADPGRAASTRARRKDVAPSRPGNAAGSPRCRCEAPRDLGT